MTATPQLHRTAERRHLTVPIRIERLEEDQDIAEARSIEVLDKLDRLNARLVGMILSTAGAAIAFAANLVMHH
jgi:hypothetical protein